MLQGVHVKYLLDTNALLYMFGAPSELSVRARRIVRDESAWMRGCRFKVYSGKVEMGKMPEKYDQVHILNSSSRRKQQ